MNNLETHINSLYGKQTLKRVTIYINIDQIDTTDWDKKVAEFIDAKIDGNFGIVEGYTIHIMEKE